MEVEKYLKLDYLNIYKSKYQVYLAVQFLNKQAVLKKSENISFNQVPSERQKNEICLKWIQSIKWTRNLPSDFIYVILISAKAVSKEIWR